MTSSASFPNCIINQIKLTGTIPLPYCYLCFAQLLDFAVKRVVDIKDVEKGIVPYALQQLFGEMADWMFAEIPLH